MQIRKKIQGIKELRNKIKKPSEKETKILKIPFR
jgi:hypothetical protein